MTTVLVTGAAGFIGANFVRYWHERYPADSIVALDALTYAGRRDSLATLEDSEALLFVEGSVCDEELVARLLRDHDIELIVHFAAESHVDRSIANPDAFVDTNIVGTYRLLKQARAAWHGPAGPLSDRAGRRFHHVSTDEVYGSLAAGEPAFSEATPYAPNSPYAASKAAADHLARAYHRTYGLNLTASNCSNNYGPYQFPEKLIPLCLLNILHGRDLPIYGDGRQVRDWLHVTDHCRGIERVIRAGQAGRTYNIGGDNEQANIDVVESLCAAVDGLFAGDSTLADRFPAAPGAQERSARELITFVADRPGHDTRYAVDSGRIAAELGFAPVTDFATGLRATVDWYLTNEAWWRAILAE